MGHIFWWAVAGAAYCIGLLTFLVLPDAGAAPRVMVWAAPGGAFPIVVYALMLIRRYWPGTGPVPPATSLVGRPRAAIVGILLALVTVAVGLVTVAGADSDRFVPVGEPKTFDNQYFVDDEGTLTPVSQTDYEYLVGLDDRRMVGYTLLVFLVTAMGLALGSERVTERLADQTMAGTGVAGSG